MTRIWLTAALLAAIAGRTALAQNAGLPRPKQVILSSGFTTNSPAF